VTLVGFWRARTWLAPMARRARPDSRVAVLGLGAAVVAGVGLISGKWGLPILLALALAVPLVFALRRRPQQGVIVLVALVPFDGLRLISHLPSSVSTWKELLVLAILGATFLAPPEARAKSDHRRLPSWAPAVIGLLVLGLVSATVVGGEQAITGFRIDYFYLLLAVAVWRCPLSEKEKDRFVTVLMVTGALTALVGIAQQVMGGARLNALGYPYNTVIVTAGGHLRSFSTFASNFEFAFFLMVVLLMGLPCALSDTRRFRNRAFLAYLPIFAAALLLTFTRGAWLGLAIGGVYLGLRRYRLLLLAVPAVVLAFAFLPGSITSTSFSSASLSERGVGWQQNFEQVLSHPFGVGIGAAGAAAAKVAKLEAGGTQVDTSVPGSPTYQPDNYYYKTVYELGVLGLWLWILLLASAFASAARIARTKSGSESSFALGAAACVAAAAAASLVATFFEIFPMDVLFWLLIGTVAASRWSGEASNDQVWASASAVR
jgi:hypothetical protein